MSKILIMYGDECAIRHSTPGRKSRARSSPDVSMRNVGVTVTKLPSAAEQRSIPVTRDGQQVGDLYHRPLTVARPTIPGGESAHRIRLVDGERDPGEAVEKLFRRRGEGDASSGQRTVLATGPGVVDLRTASKSATPARRVRTDSGGVTAANACVRTSTDT